MFIKAHSLKAVITQEYHATGLPIRIPPSYELERGEIILGVTEEQGVNQLVAFTTDGNSISKHYRLSNEPTVYRREMSKGVANLTGLVLHESSFKDASSFFHNVFFGIPVRWFDGNGGIFIFTLDKDAYRDLVESEGLMDSVNNVISPLLYAYRGMVHGKERDLYSMLSQSELQEYIDLFIVERV